MATDHRASLVVHGNIRKDQNGRLIIDDCVSDQDHLQYAVTDVVANKPICRVALDSVFDGLVGRKGQLLVSVRFVEDL